MLGKEKKCGQTKGTRGCAEQNNDKNGWLIKNRGSQKRQSRKAEERRRKDKFGLAHNF